ncbi:MAG: WD40 repeat domain-containing serine/threonine-protein kinase [Planctomycetota bacterium]
MSISEDHGLGERTHPASEAFAKALAMGESPEIGDFLTEESPAFLLGELISIDMRFHHRLGAPKPFRHYLESFPRLASNPWIVAQLADADVLLRRNSGETINPRDYPAWALPSPPPAKQNLAIPGSQGPSFHRMGEIGRGGMSIVYLARQAVVNRLVALKVLKTEEGRLDSRDVLRFLSEAEAIASIRHRHVVQIHEFGAPEGEPPFLALEYLPGGTLATKLSRGPIPAADAARLVSELASAIQAAHSLGIVHRDLKPSNVLFDENGVAKVIDFGLAKRGDAALTVTQSLMGTPAYMAPEQADRKARFVGPEADIWALGAILYECLTGRRPFPGDDGVAVLHAIRHDQPDRPGAIVPGLPRELEEICLKCLCKDPAERYPSAEALENDLGAWMNHRPISIRRPGLFGQAARWARRNRALAAAMAVTASILVLATSVSACLGIWAITERERAEEKARDSREQRLRADAKAALAEEQRSLAAAQRDRAEVVAYANHLQSAERAWEAGRPEVALENLEACRWDLRGPEHHFLFSQFNKGQATFHGHRSTVTALAIGPDMRSVISGDASGRVFAWDMWAATQFQEKPGSIVGPVGSIHVSPDNREIAIWSSNGLKVHGRSPENEWDRKLRLAMPGSQGHALVVSGNPFALGWLMVPQRGMAHALSIAHRDGPETLTALDHEAYRNRGFLGLMAVNGDGTLFAVARGKFFCVHDSRSKKRIGQIHNHATGSSVTAMDFSPDGTCLAVAFGDGALRLMRLDSAGNVVSAADLPNPALSKATIHCARFTPDGRYLLTGGETMALTAWDWRRGRVASSMMGHRMPIRSMAISPDGRFAATGSEDCTIRVHDLGLVNEERHYCPETGNHRAVALSSDGKVAASFERSARHLLVLEAEEGRVSRRYSDPAPDSMAMALSGNGERLAMACQDGSVRVIKLRTGRYLPDIPSLGGVTKSLALNDGGDTLLVVTAFPGEPMDAGAVRLIDTATGNEIFRCRDRGLGAIQVARVPGIGPTAITGDSEGRILLWNNKGIAEPLERADFKPRTGAVRDIACSLDGARFASGHSDGTVLAWKAGERSATEIASFRGWTVEAVSLSDRNRVLACVRLPSDRVMAVFHNASTGTQLLSTSLDCPGLGKVQSVALAQGNGNPSILVGHEKGLRRLATDRVQDIHWLAAPDRVRHCRISPDARTVSATVRDLPPLEWDLATGQLLADTKHTGSISPRTVKCVGMGSHVLATEMEAREANRVVDSRFTAMLSRPDPDWHRLHAALADKASIQFSEVFHLAMARKSTFWDWDLFQKEWEALSKARSSPMVDSLRLQWALDITGRLLLTPGRTPDPRALLAEN